MSGRKINEKTVSIPEVKKIMDAVKEKIEEIDSEEGLSHFQEITYNYVNKFAKMSEKDAIKENYAISIVNIDPHTVPEMRMMLEKSFTGKSLNDEQLQDLIAQIEELKSS